jgi:hypothetical protein
MNSWSGRPQSEVVVDRAGRTLAMPPLQYGLPARLVFRLIDLIYGPERTWQKFKVKKINARMPCQASESVSYNTIAHTHEENSIRGASPRESKRAAEEQDNEQWHLLIIQEWMNRKGLRQSKVNIDSCHGCRPLASTI